MYLKIAEYLFITIASILALLLMLQKLYVYKLKDNIKKAEFISVTTAFLLVYMLNALCLTFMIDSVINKLVMFLFAISPFIIGKLVTYEKENLYSAIQIICIIISIVFVILL